MADFQLDDRAFLEGLHTALADFKVLGHQDSQKRAQRIKARAQQLVHVASGATRDSLTVEVGPDYVDVGSSLERAFHEEFGTHHMSPKPFMRPAIEEEMRE